jgi:Sugar-transfer associated ATP-grasp
MENNPDANAGTLKTVGATPEFVSPVNVDQFKPPAPLGPTLSWRQWVAFDHCRILLPQFVFARNRDPLAQLYRLSLDEGEPRPRAGAFARFGARLIFAVVALRQAWLYFRRYGSFVRKTSGILRGRQLRDLWYCAWRQNQSPRHYYWRKLYLLPERQAWLGWLEHRQVNTLLTHLNRRLPIENATDKVRFFEHCLAHNLPTPPVLAAWDECGRIATIAPRAVATELFLKPASEYGSVGVVAIEYQATSGKHRLNAAELAWSDLLNAIGDLARTDGRSLILQRRLRNAARNAIYGDSDICNLRIVTGCRPGGEPEAIGSFVRLPSSMTTAGHERKVLTASVDLRTGRMEAGRFREPLLGEFPVHPNTGAPIKDRILPGWDEMLALALRGHRTYPWLPFIGWDVVDTTDGVMLLEANAYWAGALALGHTRFPEIYLEWFEQLYGTTAE